MVPAIEADPRSIAEWSPTVAMVRDVVQRYMVTGPDWSETFNLPAIAHDFAPTQREVETVCGMCLDAVQHGRLVDFGMLPNDVIMQGGNRGGPLWNQGALGMPFSEPWMFLHSWEQGVAIYMVNPHAAGDFEVCELCPMSIGDQKMLTIGDRGLFDRVEGMQPQKRYHCSVAPSAIRYIEGDLGSRANNGGAISAAAASNIGDPTMTALLILNTRNVTRETVAAPEKLQRARMKSNKARIPPHDVVHTAPYVTAILASGKARRGEHQGGTHASPQYHLRMGHPRHYANGRSIFIADTLVNATEEQRNAFKTGRSHYAVRS
jgi:hypothetical protein